MRAADGTPAEAPVEKWTPERRRARTRAALVDAARYVFARKGFEGASLDEIAETAGYTRGAIYKHFDGKEALLFAVYDQANEMALARFADLLDADPPMLDPTAVVATWQELFAGDDDLRVLDLELRLYQLRHPDARERATAHALHNRELVATFMRSRGAEAGFDFALPVEELSAILLITADAFRDAVQFLPDAPELYRRFLESYLPAVITTPIDGAPAAPRGNGRRRSSGRSRRD